MNGKFTGVIKRKIRMDVSIEIAWPTLITDKMFLIMPVYLVKASLPDCHCPSDVIGSHVSIFPFVFQTDTFQKNRREVCYQ